MVSITSDTVSDNFSQNVCAAFQCMIKIFKHQDAGTFTHYKTISFFVERNGCTIRISACGQSSKCRKTGDADFADRCFCSTCKHQVCVTMLDAAESFSD